MSVSLTVRRSQNRGSYHPLSTGWILTSGYIFLQQELILTMHTVLAMRGLDVGAVRTTVAGLNFYRKYVIICTLPFKKTCRPSGRHILFLLFGSKSFR